MDNINYKKLRKDLIEYFEDEDPCIDFAIMDVVDIELADEKELLDWAKKAGFNLKKYRK